MAIKLDGATLLELGARVMPSQPGTVLAFFSRDGGGDQYAWMQEDSASARWTGVYTAGGTDSVYGTTHPISGGGGPGTAAVPVNTTMRLAMHVTPASAGTQSMYYGSATPATGTGQTDESSYYNRMTVGGRHANGGVPDLFMNGSIAELHFYNVALTATDYTNIANGTVKPESVAGWVDGFQLKTATDLTSMGGTRTLTVIGSGATTSAVAHPITRTAGAAVNLVGTNSVETPTSSTGAATVTPAGTPATATVTSDVFKGFGGLALTGLTIPNVMLIKLDRTVVLSLANQVTNGSGQLVITSVALTSVTDYMLVTFNADGTVRGCKKVTAV
jgi:hypothetical protein